MSNFNDIFSDALSRGMEAVIDAVRGEFRSWLEENKDALVREDDEWAYSQRELGEILRFGKEEVKAVMEDPDLQPAIIRYGQRKVNINVTMLRKLMKSKEDGKRNTIQRAGRP